ncbi:tetratricopeptide repeat protein [Nocardia australiensis]|uniref:tetratricopeptide repeat protein n=1 Tax=Nocardia australiensis TaxID=2887191 RepID=UPI001D158858|nr:tetratricopeptide repeat protein [Nocardia australiensis]
MHPDDGSKLLAEGAAAYGRGDVAEALRQFEDIARTSTGGLRVSALINAASMCDELGDHTGAITRFREGLAEMPQDAIEKRPAALINLSQALQHVGDLDGAQAALEQAHTILTSNDDQTMTRVACLLSLTAVAFHRQQWAYAIEIATESLDAAMRFAPHLAGHPLSTLSGIHFETGRRELGLDFAGQALAAFEAAGDTNAVAETEQNLAVMYVRADRLDEAEELLRSSQEYFERSGLGYRAGVGLETMGFLAEGRDDDARADELYGRALADFRASGAVLDAADVQVRLASVAYSTGRFDEGEDLLAAAFNTYAERGLGLHCAQIDFWHAALYESVIEATPQPDPELLSCAVDLAVASALAIDAVRHTLPNGNQREQWNRQIADPAMRLAFRFAYLSGDGRLIDDLIETQCAGTTLNIDRSESQPPTRLPLDLLPAPEDPPTVTNSDAASAPRTAQPPGNPPDHGPVLHLGAALASVAASAGLPVAPPPRIAVAPDGHIALAGYIAAAEQRYGRPVRDSRVLRA